MPSYLPEALLLGLSTGPICLAYCAPVLVPLVLAAEKYTLIRTVRLLSLFLLGRFIGYMTIGLLSGLIGSAIFRHEGGTLPALVSLAMGVALLIFGLLKNFPEFKLCKIWPGGKSSIIWASVLGLLTGLNLCPPFIAAIAGSALTGTVQGSMLYFGAFFVGTSLFIPPLLILGPLSRITSLRHIAKACLILCGIWFTFKGLFMLVQ
jgi:sulfite exporter TauE/SafE